MAPLSDTFGEVGKDFIDEGPFRAVFGNIEIDSPKSLSNVRLWFTDPDTYDTYYVGKAGQSTDDDGEVIYEFFVNTQNVQRQKSDGTLESSVVALAADKIYLAEVTYELSILAKKAIGARREVLVRESYSITF